MSGPEKTQQNGATHKKEDSAGVFAMSLFAAGIGLYVSLFVGWLVLPELLYSKQHQPIDFNHAIHMEQVDGCTDCHVFRDDGTYAGAPTLSQCIDCHEDVQSVEPDPEDENYEDLMKQYKAEVKFVEEYVANDKEVPWLIYARQPDCVFFSHAAHLNSEKFKVLEDGKIGAPPVEFEDDEEPEDARCNMCHMAFIKGEAVPFGEAESLPVYEENRITTYSRDIWGRNFSGFNKHYYDSAKMDDCAQCHNDQRNEGKSKDACFVCHK
ncbi:MAG: cytochrome c3 family protein [Desulfatibacillum sp.]|nr:cytochrome c3 family protein [Desulfatibacillum sp.]